MSELEFLTRKKEQGKVKREEYTFAQINNMDSYYNSIDLFGQRQMNAVNITQTRLLEIKKALQERKIKPNHTENDHIFKVIAHKGNGSKGGIGVLKFAIEDLLKEMHCDYYSDMHNGVFLVRIKLLK